MTTCERRASLRALAVATSLVVATLASGAAQAQAEDQAAARALFSEGRRLIKQGDYDKACPKLEAASKLYPGSGVLLNLANCFEHTNHLASAWAVFGEAASIAQRAGRADDEAEAKRRQAALEPRHQRITIHVATDLPTLVVRRDDKPIDRGAWDTALPVDAGSHVITAEATGRLPWRAVVAVTQPGETLRVEVPELTPAPPLALPVPPPPEPEKPAPVPATEAAPIRVPAETPSPAVATARPGYWTGRRIAGVTTFGAGVVGVGVGGILGLVAKSEFTTAVGERGAAQRADSSSAVNEGNTATVVMAVGGAVAVTGFVLWLTSPNATVTVSTTGREVFARWAF